VEGIASQLEYTTAIQGKVRVNRAIVVPKQRAQTAEGGSVNIAGRDNRTGDGGSLDFEAEFRTEAEAEFWGDFRARLDGERRGKAECKSGSSGRLLPSLSIGKSEISNRISAE